MPDYIIKAPIFKFKMAAGYHVDGDGYPAASFFFGVRIMLGTILGRFSIIYFRGLGLRIRVRVWVRVCVSVMVRVRVSVVFMVRVSLGLGSELGLG